jgi:hypothetical protein
MSAPVASPRASLRSRRHSDVQKGIEAVRVAAVAKRHDQR